jgi:hypothetical protein
VYRRVVDPIIHALTLVALDVSIILTHQQLTFATVQQYIMPFTYAVRIYLDKEFAECSQTSILCQNQLDSLDIDPDDIWWYWLGLLGLFIVMRASALVLLKQKANRYY